MNVAGQFRAKATELRRLTDGAVSSADRLCMLARASELDECASTVEAMAKAIRDRGTVPGVLAPERRAFETSANALDGGK